MNRRHLLTTPAAVAMLALAPLGASGVALAAATHPRARSAARTGIIDCSGREVSAPRSYVLACGDGDTSLAHLRWTGWGARTATATGTEVLNLCTPDCADGRDARFRVSVVADRLRDGLYRALVVHAGAGRPHGVPRTERWTPIKRGQ